MAICSEASVDFKEGGTIGKTIIPKISKMFLIKLSDVINTSDKLFGPKKRNGNLVKNLGFPDNICGSQKANLIAFRW